MLPSDNAYDAKEIELGNRRPSLARLSRVWTVVGVALVGVVLGSFVSVLMARRWFPAEESGDVAIQTIGAVLLSPMGMTLGLIPTFRLLGWVHGCLVLLGIGLTITGTCWQFRASRYRSGLLVFVGVLLWSHNNYLAAMALLGI